MPPRRRRSGASLRRRRRESCARCPRLKRKRGMTPRPRLRFRLGRLTQLKRLEVFMSLVRAGVMLFVGSFFVLALFAEPPQRKGAPPAPPSSASEVIQEFPSNDVMRTAWKVNWATATGYGLYLQDAWFKRGP